jgi:hypothetical protein
MAKAQFQVASYNYYHWSSRTRGTVNLNLRGTGGQQCAVWFTEDLSAPLPPARQVAPNVYAFYYHLPSLPALIDMLRNEGPVWVFFDDDNGWPNSRLSTTEEPVGEGELSGMP